MTFLFLLLFYEIFPVRKAKMKKKEMVEIRYLKNRYSLDYDNIPSNQLIQICAIVSSLDISIAVGIISLLESFWYKIVFGFIIVFLLILISYHFVYLFYKKKGLVKNGKH